MRVGLPILLQLSMFLAPVPPSYIGKQVEVKFVLVDKADVLKPAMRYLIDNNVIAKKLGGKTKKTVKM